MPSRRGYTLIELLLVMAMVIIAVAVVAPSVMQSSERSELEDAAEKVATMWGRARLDAISAGGLLVFQCEIGASVGQVQSPDAAFADPELGEVSPSAGGQNLQLQNVVFRSVLVGEPAGAEPLGIDSREGEFSPVVVFRPDGATSDAEALLEHTSGLQMKVVLRGLTGATRVEDVAAAE